MKYRLDDLIRKGAELTDFRKFEVYNKEENSACANGAAMIGLRKVKGEEMPEESILTVPRSIHNIGRVFTHQVPNCGKNTYLKAEAVDDKVNVTSAIAALNDSGDMSRKAIAEWVGWLIDEKGYDLYVEVEEEGEEDLEEKENIKIPEKVIA